MEFVKYGERRAIRKVFAEDSRTKQSFRDECDINRIVAQYKRTGEMPHERQSQPRYGDFTDAIEYQEACNRVIAAKAAFAALPARVRDRMDNDPARLLAFLADPENQAEAVELGLIDELDDQVEVSAGGSDGVSDPPESGGEMPPQIES